VATFAVFATVAAEVMSLVLVALEGATFAGTFGAWDFFLFLFLFDCYRFSLLLSSYEWAYIFELIKWVATG